MDLCGRARVLCDIGCSRDYVDGQPVVVSGIDRMMIDRGAAETGIRTTNLNGKIPPLKSNPAFATMSYRHPSDLMNII